MHLSVLKNVKISIRPEEFIIEKENGSGISAVVDDCIFLGLNTHYFVHLKDGTKLNIVMESETDSTIPKGASITLGVKKEKINIFTGDGKKNIVLGVQNDLEV